MNFDTPEAAGSPPGQPQPPSPPSPEPSQPSRPVSPKGLKVPGVPTVPAEPPRKEEKEGKPDGTPSNQDFLDCVFGELPAGAAALVCSKAGDPTDNTGWSPREAADVPSVCAGTNNNYFNCSSFRRPEQGSTRATKEAFAAYHALVLDDVGTKIDKSKLDGIEPSWWLETSPGNFQVGFILSPPITEAAELERLQERIVAHGLCDPGALGSARWMRLPNGVNGKAKYRTDDQPYRCKLTSWAPERRLSADELALHLKLSEVGPLQPARPGVSSPRRRDDDVCSFPQLENPTLAALKKKGLHKRVLGAGKHEITCPWVNEHTDQVDGGACYWEPDDDHPLGGFRCQHSHGDRFHIRELLTSLEIDTEGAQNKPVIRLVGGAFDRVIRAAEEALAATGNMYQAGGSIAALHEDPSTGELRIELLSEQRLKRELARIAIWKQPAGDGKWRIVDPPQGHVNGLLKAGQYDVLPPLRGLARQPYFKPDGTLVLKAGYDEETGIYAAFEASKFGDLDLTRTGAVEALAELKELLAEFHFAKDQDRSAALSAILTATARPSLALAPAFSITASSPGSGKSYLADLIAAFATPGHAKKVSYPSSSDEATKAILSHLITGPAVVIFDDMTTDWKAFGSINRMLTSERMADRLLTTNRVQEVSTRTLFIGTGNNIEPLNDLRRRVLPIRIQPMSANPALLSYTGRPVDAVRSNRDHYVRLALQIIMACRQAGSPKSAEFPIASYGEWSDLCREPLLWLGEPDPAAAFRHQLEDDPDAETLKEFLTAWHGKRGERPTMVRELISATATLGSDQLQEAMDELPVWDGSKINPSRLGWYIKKHCGRIAGDLMIEQAPKGERRAWQVVKVALPAPPPPPLKGEKEETDPVNEHPIGGSDQQSA